MPTASSSTARATCMWPIPGTTAWSVELSSRSRIHPRRAPPRPATRVITIGRFAAVVLMLAAGVHPVAAQEVSPEACADMKEQIRYLVNEGAFIQEAGLKEGVDL